MNVLSSTGEKGYICSREQTAPEPDMSAGKNGSGIFGDHASG
ncbi:hypothetical protein [Brucepastera parasyntrophica]|nr:hypothetical protein [Brucepastera parasyntrophica]